MHIQSKKKVLRKVKLGDPKKLIFTALSETTERCEKLARSNEKNRKRAERARKELQTVKEKQGIYTYILRSIEKIKNTRNAIQISS